MAAITDVPEEDHRHLRVTFAGLREQAREVTGGGGGCLQPSVD